MMINAVKLYRISNRHYKAGIPLTPDLIKLLIFLIYNSSIPYQCEIGEGTIFGYGGISVVIHKDAVIGKKVYYFTMCHCRRQRRNTWSSNNRE